MNASNGLYKEIKMDWDAITLPLKGGTPVSANGVVANNDKAIGLVPRTISVRPVTPSIYVLIGGAVDLAAVQAESGLTISDDAKKHMSGILFYGDDDTPGPDPVWTIPTASASTLGGVKIGNGINISSGKISVASATESVVGGVKKAANVSTAAGDAPTAAEFDALISALITAGIMAAGE